jgi:hypothetical protein
MKTHWKDPKAEGKKPSELNGTLILRKEKNNREKWAEPTGPAGSHQADQTCILRIPEEEE